MDNYSYRVSVKGLVLDEENRLMLLQEESGLWDLPGGSMEHGESFQETLKREIKEEMGVDCEMLDKEPVLIWSGKSSSDIWRVWIAFRVKLLGNNFTKSREFQNYKYFSENDLINSGFQYGAEKLSNYLSNLKNV